MSRPRVSRNIESRGILEALQCDEDSDIDEVQVDDEIFEMVSEMREVIEERNDRSNDDEEELLEPGPAEYQVSSRGQNSRPRARVRSSPFEVVSEMREELIEERNNRSNDDEEELLEPGPSEHQISSRGQSSRPRGRGRSGSRGRGRSGLRGRGRGRTTSRGRRRSSLPIRTERENDEATGWTYVMREVPLSQPVFQSQIGVNAPVDENSSQYDCLQLFFTSDFWKLVKTETNRYASQMKAKLARKGELKPRSMMANWKPVTTAELKQFFSIIIHMTLVQKETFDSYWSTRPILYNPFASQVMKRDRFRAIYSCLHLNDNSNYISRGNENYDAFFKLRLYFDDLCQLCESYYLPNENLTIDEGTCGFRGRVHFRVFNKDKPDKYGMKIYMLCDSETGYVLRMIPYVGDSKTVEEIVMGLLEPYFGKWHTVYMDRFFTNPITFDLLWLKDTRAVGTVMLNQRGLPQEWRNQPLEVNEMAFCHRGNLTACKWKDKRDVSFLTTKHAASWSEVEVKAKGGKIKRIKPDCILDYNVNKIGVDLNDQYVSYYSLHRKSMKWWKKMFFHLVARSMVNAYIIYFKTHAPAARKGFAHFLTQAGEDMAIDGGWNREEQVSHGPQARGAVTRLTGRHFMAKIPPSEQKQVRSRACKVCADIGKKETGKRGRKETVFYCPDCNVPLCNIPCFKLYHTKKDYTS